MSKKNGADFIKWFGPLLDALRDLGYSGKPKEASNKIAENLNLPDELLDETLNQDKNRFHNQVAWARQYLVWEGLLDSSKHGTWKLTDKGKRTSLTNDDAKKIFQKWVDIHRKTRKKRSENEIIKEQEEKGPEELENTSSFDLLEVLQNLSPSGFERISRELLREHGFENVYVTGGSHDGGIDGYGTLEINPFVSFKVLFQCKRYKGSVSRAQVGDFRNAMIGRAEKGIIITTGTFTNEATKEANREGAPQIELVDGTKLVEMFEKVELGVMPKTVFEVDLKYFRPFMEQKSQQVIMQTKITNLFNIKYPIIQGGMIWCSGWKLAAAVSNAGGLGLIGAGSMHPEVFEDHLRKIKKATDKPFGVNLPLLYPQMDEIVEIVLREKIGIVFTSAGNPKKWTPVFKENGVKVVHVIANTKFAGKAMDAGVDAIVAEGFEAGGHNGIEETTTMALIPLIRKTVDIPVIAAGGIATGQQMLAAMALGADGVQVGSRFAASQEASCHESFKQKIVEAKDGDTKLTLKRVVPVRLIKNKFFHTVEDLENKGASIEDIKTLLGHGRAKLGMFEGNADEGEMEIGQVSALIDEIKPAGEIVQEMVKEYELSRKGLAGIQFG